MSKKFLVSPAGEAVFPHLNTPDKRFNNAGKYSVSLLMNPAIPEHKRYLDEIAEIVKTEVGEGAISPVRDYTRKFGGVPGLKMVKFSSSYAPKILDAANKLWDMKRTIGAGSTIKVAATPHVYKNIAGKSGVNLYLSAVQVRKLVEPHVAGPDDWGFGPSTPEAPNPVSEGAAIGDSLAE